MATIRGLANVIAAAERAGNVRTVDESLAELLAALAAHAEQSEGGKAKGAIVVKLGFVVEEGAVAIDVSTSVKLPAGRPARTVAFLSPEGVVREASTRQIELFGGQREDVAAEETEEA